jgi:hypothetical protein
MKVKDLNTGEVKPRNGSAVVPAATARKVQYMMGFQFKPVCCSPRQFAGVLHGEIRMERGDEVVIIDYHTGTATIPGELEEVFKL